jgi:SET domain-containing protein
MPRRPFRIGRSLTGLGLFATREIKKGARIAEYTGRRIRNSEADKHERRGNRYLFEINKEWTIDGTPRSNIDRRHAAQQYRALRQPLLQSQCRAL